MSKTVPIHFLGENILLVLAIAGAAMGLWKGIRAIRAEQKRSHAAEVMAEVERREQTEMLNDISKEFKPNGGDSVTDRLTRIEGSVTDHHRVADAFFIENAAAHERINERIDLLMSGGRALQTPTPRKQAERHRNREDEE